MESIFTDCFINDISKIDNVIPIFEDMSLKQMMWDALVEKVMLFNYMVNYSIYIVYTVSPKMYLVLVYLIEIDPLWLQSYQKFC